MKTLKSIALSTATFAMASIATLSSVSAHAENFTSKYSSLSEAACSVLVEQDEQYAKWKCNTGLAGLELYYVTSDARDTLEFSSPDARFVLDLNAVTFGAFNSLGNKLEWRGTTSDGHFAPFANILRVYVSSYNSQGEPVTVQKLAVTKINGWGTCVVGYVNASVHANANELARKLADSTARDFICGQSKPVAIN